MTMTKTEISKRYDAQKKILEEIKKELVEFTNAALDDPSSNYLAIRYNTICEKTRKFSVLFEIYYDDMTND